MVATTRTAAAARPEYTYPACGTTIPASAPAVRSSYHADEFTPRCLSEVINAGCA
jgi:lipoate synthase